ncbi:MAG TPA: hypothetical protein VEP66_17425 [Myxococcales bacterium]|nr:hypothetical protein [Myxococcales bacterium]
MSGSTRASARSWMRPCSPQPQTVATRDSGRARCLAATAVAAPVRRTVISIESITASGRPCAASASTITPWMAGRPDCRGFSGKLPLTFAAK